MSRSPVRIHHAKSLLPAGIRDIPFRGKVADCLGLFGLLVLLLGLICLLGETSFSVQSSNYLQTLGFLLLGLGQLFFLQKKLTALLKKRVRLFSREGWAYIGVLSVLLAVLLLFLYLFTDSSHLSMAGVSLCAFLLPFTVSNAREIFRDRRAQAVAERKKIRIRAAALLGGISLFLLVGLSSLTGRQTPVPHPDPGPLPVRSGVRTAPISGKVGLAFSVLNECASHLLELDARFSQLAQKDTAASPADLARARRDIKEQEYALGHLLDSLDSRDRELSPLISPFRSLLNGHRILSGFQNDTVYN